MKKLLGTIFVMLLANTAIAERANLFINLYGVNPDTNWNYQVRIQSAATRLERQAEYLQRPEVASDERRSFGRRIKLENVFFDSEHPAILILISASPESGDKRGVEYFFPLHRFEAVVADGANLTVNLDTMRAYSDKKDAVQNGYPFYEAGRRVSINAENLVAPLNATREIVRVLKPSPKGWQSIYSIYQENALLISQNDDVLREIINVLHDYSEINADEGFLNFYLVFLEKMIRQDFGDNQFTNNQTLIDTYFLQELSNLVKEKPKLAYDRMIEVLEALDSQEKFDDCLGIATTFFDSIATSVTTETDFWLQQSKDLLGVEIVNGMIASTHCAQKLYSIKDDSGSRQDVKGGAKFIVSQGGSRIDYARSFVGLLDTLQTNGVLTTSNRSILEFKFHYQQEISAQVGG